MTPKIRNQGLIKQFELNYLKLILKNIILNCLIKTVS